MSADLNFEAEPYGGFSGSHGEEEFESVMVRDHRGGGAPVVSGQRGGYPGGTVVRDHRGVSSGGTYGGVFGGQRAGYPGGTVVRDHRYGGTTVSVRPAASTTSLWRPGWGSWGGRGWGGWGGWGRGGNWGRWGDWSRGGGPGWRRWGAYGTPSGYWSSRYYQPGAPYFGALTPGTRGYYPYGSRHRTGYSPWPWLAQGGYQAGYAAAPSIGVAPSIAEPAAPLEPQVIQEPQTVAWVQACLAQLVGPWVPQDGNLGPATQRAIQMFQTQTQLPPSGSLDDNTLIALQQACQTAAAAASSAAPSGPPGGLAMSPPPSAAAASPPSAASGAQTEAFEFFPQEFGGPYEMEFPQEFGGPYEMEFPQEFGGPYEMELEGWPFETVRRRPADRRNLLAFKIPEAPYSEGMIKWVHKTIDVVDSLNTAMEIFGVELSGLLGLGVAAIAPLASWVGTFFALGAGYAEGRSVIARRRVRSGFAIGVVMGADGAKWPYVKRMFWEYGPESNTFDQEAGRIAQKAFNTGLATGYLQGREIADNPKKMRFFWDSISASLTPGDRSEFAGDSKSWPELTWRNWYLTAGAKFSLIYLKD